MAYNTRNPAVKRLMREAQELKEPTEMYHARPLEDNLFEWHFTIRGPADTDFDGGIYHGRILLPPEYPMKPPNILLLTPNGRFEVNRKICLSISGFHPETWRPSWSIRTALLAIIGFMPTHGAGAIGSLDYPPDQRRKLARESLQFSCSSCGCVGNILKAMTNESQKLTEEAKTLASEMTINASTKSETLTENSAESSATPSVSQESENVAGQSDPQLQNPAPAGSAANWCQMMPTGWMTAAGQGLLSNSQQFPFLHGASPPAQPLTFSEWLENIKNIKLNDDPAPSSATTTANVPYTSASETQIRERVQSPSTAVSSPATTVPYTPTVSHSTRSTPPAVPMTLMDKLLFLVALFLAILVGCILFRNIFII